MTYTHGRRLTFDDKTRRYLAKLIGQHGLIGALERTAIPVSSGTLLKIVKEFEIPLSRGRRPLSASPIASPKLTKIQTQHLLTALGNSARLHGYNSDHWTLRRVAEMVERFFTFKCRSCDVRPLVESMGFVVTRAGALVSTKPGRSNSERADAA